MTEGGRLKEQRAKHRTSSFLEDDEVVLMMPGSFRGTRIVKPAAFLQIPDKNRQEKRPKQGMRRHVKRRLPDVDAVLTVDDFGALEAAERDQREGKATRLG